MILIRHLNRALASALSFILSVLFAGLIIVVFLQVFARNVLEIPLVWTLDIAQLLFTWCIFLGAALAIKWDAHYNLDLVPDNWKRTGSVLKIVGHIASAIVIFVLIYHGALFTELGSDRTSPSLGITEFWYFVAIPLGGAAMALFLIEIIPDDLAELRTAFSGKQP